MERICRVVSKEGPDYAHDRGSRQQTWGSWGEREAARQLRIIDNSLGTLMRARAGTINYGWPAVFHHRAHV
jgi:hypothetical protein